MSHFNGGGVHPPGLLASAREGRPPTQSPVESRRFWPRAAPSSCYANPTTAAISLLGSRGQPCNMPAFGLPQRPLSPSIPSIHQSTEPFVTASGGDDGRLHVKMDDSRPSAGS